MNGDIPLEDDAFLAQVIKSETSKISGRVATPEVPDFLKALTAREEPENVSFNDSVVIDEKAFKPGLLFSAVNKGMTTLSFEHGKALRFIRRGDWVMIQILDAGCGKKIKHQSAPFSAKRMAKKNIQTTSLKGNEGTSTAWSE
jgi:hypothetical protein